MPENLYWIEGPWPGRLALLTRPRGGEWLADDVRVWRRTGLDVIVSFLTTGENAELDLSREGIGRSALLAASLLVHSGVGAEKAFERIEKARGCPVPDTAEQRHWVEQFGTMEMLPAP